MLGEKARCVVKIRLLLFLRTAMREEVAKAGLLKAAGSDSLCFLTLLSTSELRVFFDAEMKLKPWSGNCLVVAQEGEFHDTQGGRDCHLMEGEIP